MFSFCMGIFILNEWKYAQGLSSKLIMTEKYIFMSDIVWEKNRPYMVAVTENALNNLQLLKF